MTRCSFLTRGRRLALLIGVLGSLTACADTVSAPLAGDEIRGEVRVAEVQYDSTARMYTVVGGVTLDVSPSAAVLEFVVGDPSSGQLLTVGPTPTSGRVTILRVPPVRTTRLPADLALQRQEAQELQLPRILRWRLRLREGVDPRTVEVKLVGVQRVGEKTIADGRVLDGDLPVARLGDWANVRRTETP